MAWCAIRAGSRPRLMMWVEVLDQGDLIAEPVIAEMVNQAPGEHDPESPFAKSQFVADFDVADRVFVRGGVREVFGVETRDLRP